MSNSCYIIINKEMDDKRPDLEHSFFTRSCDLLSQGLCFLCTEKILLCPTYLMGFYENQERKNYFKIHIHILE